MSSRYRTEPPLRVRNLWVIAVSYSQRHGDAGWAWCNKAVSALILVTGDEVRCLGVNGQTLDCEWAYERAEGLRQTVAALKR